MKKARARKPGENKNTFSVFSNYRFIYSRMWRFDKSLIWYGIAEVIFNVIMPLGGILIPSIVIGLLIRKATVREFIITLAAVFVIYGIITGIRFFLNQRNNMQYINMRLYKFWEELFSKAMDMDYHLFEKEKTRLDMEKATNALSGNREGVEGFMHRNVSLAGNILGLITYACIISSIHPLILLLLLIISLLQLLSFNHAKKYEISRKDDLAGLWMTQNYFQSQSYDLKTGKDIRLYRLDELINRVYRNANQKARQIASRIRGRYYINDITSIVLQFLRDAICYGYLIFLLIKGMDLSLFVLYLGVISGFADWFTKITEDISEISRCHTMICDLRKFLEQKNEFLHGTGKVLEDSGTALDIVFDHVSYRYKGSEKNILNDISFHMEKGRCFSLVGINGAGKTTIVKLLCGFYRPTHGKILVNGVDTRELDIDRYFEQIAVIFQDPLLLSFTIAENISGLMASEIDRKKLEKVLNQSGLSGKVEGLAKGADTYINKDMENSGVQLSGGELQKLMLARALYKNAKLLILDEPTAALDAIAESELYEQYQTLLKGRTSLFISHRLASTRFCDYILYLEDGRITEEGSHEELMLLGGRYANMFGIQSKYYKEEGGMDREIKEDVG